MDENLRYFKSSFCMANGNQCAELAHLPGGGVRLRNSQRPDASVEFDAGEWSAFIAGAKNGEFDSPVS